MANFIFCRLNRKDEKNEKEAQFYKKQSFFVNLRVQEFSCYLIECLQHDVNAAAKQHRVCTLYPDFEGVPDGQLAGRLGSNLLGLDGPLVDEGGEVVTVVIVKPLEEKTFLGIILLKYNN